MPGRCPQKEFYHQTLLPNIEIGGAGEALMGFGAAERRVGGDLPGPLFVHGGLAPTGLSALLFRPDGVSTHLDLTLEQLQDLLQQGEPLWVRIKGLGSPGLLAQVMSMLRVPDDLQPVLVETPQRTRVDAVGDVLQVVTHRLSMGASGRVISEQVGVVLIPNLVFTVQEVPL